MSNIIQVKFGKKKDTSALLSDTPNTNISCAIIGIGNHVKVEVAEDVENESAISSFEQVINLPDLQDEQRTECLVFDPMIHNTYPNDIPSYPGLKYIKQFINVIPMGGVKI